MDIRNTFGQKIDELILTAELTVDMFEDYMNHIMEIYREDFMSEFILRTKDNKWKNFVKKKSLTITPKETHIEVDLKEIYHPFWDKIDDDTNVKNDIEYDILAHENWLKRKEREILDIFGIIDNYRKENNQQEIEEVLQVDEINIDPHPNIFSDIGYQLWLELKKKFGINEKCRADVKFIFEKMKKDKLIHKTVRQVDFLNWINDTYELAIEKTSQYDLYDTKSLAIYDTTLELLKSRV